MLRMKFNATPRASGIETMILTWAVARSDPLDTPPARRRRLGRGDFWNKTFVAAPGSSLWPFAARSAKPKRCLNLTMAGRSKAVSRAYQPMLFRGHGDDHSAPCVARDLLFQRRDRHRCSLKSGAVDRKHRPRGVGPAWFLTMTVEALIY
jgi:hypothetical protein